MIKNIFPLPLRYFNSRGAAFFHHGYICMSHRIQLLPYGHSQQLIQLPTWPLPKRVQFAYVIVFESWKVWVIRYSRDGERQAGRRAGQTPPTAHLWRPRRGTRNEYITRDKRPSMPSSQSHLTFQRYILTNSVVAHQNLSYHRALCLKIRYLKTHY